MPLYRLYETFLMLPDGLKAVLLVLLVMYVLQLSDGYVFRRRLADTYSIKPRQGNRLLAPLLAHTLHGNWKHLFGNSVPFVVLGSIIALTNLQKFWLATASIMVVGSMGTWLLGSSEGRGHLGASGLITGYFGYVISQGFFSQDVQLALMGIIISVFYFGVFRLVFGRYKGISNVMHFFGFLGGLLGAWLTPWLIQ
jgi:membrane associated rhomboid family serine protease